MKILQVIYELNPGGAERFIVDLSNELVLLGHEVHLCILLGESEGENILFYKNLLNNNVHFISLGNKVGFRISTFIKAYKLLKNLHPDIVNFHLNVIPYFFLEALLKPEIKMFHTLHNIAEATVIPIQKPFNRFYYKTNRIIPITISEECDISYRSYYKLENSICIPNGRSEVKHSKEFERIKIEINSFKRESSDLVFVHIASCSKSKNQELLINCFNLLDKEAIGFILLIIGSGFNTKYAENLKQRACSRIKFLGIKSNVGDYLLNSDAFCLTSIYEGMPITLLEALASGCTPICTPVGGIPDVIENGKTGFLSKDVTLKSYISALRGFINNPKLISKRRLIEYFKLNYSISNCTQKYLNVYKQFIILPDRN